MYAAVVPALRLPPSLPPFFDYRIPEPLLSSVTRGSVVAFPWRSSLVAGVVLETRAQSDLPDAKIKDLHSLCTVNPLAEDVVSPLSWISEETLTPLPTVLKTFFPAAPKRKIGKPHDAGALPRAAVSFPAAPGFSVHLSLAVDWEETITALVVAATQTLGAGGSLLILTPHRRDSAALLAGLRAHFSAVDVVTVDADASAGKRWEAYMEALSNTVPRILIGTRSAVLFPDPTIRHIVCLESESRDHRNFDSAPRYDARTTAHSRAVHGDFPLTFCSPTPRLEEFVLAGAPPLHSVQPPTAPTIVDIATTSRNLLAGVFPEYTINAIDDALQAGSSVLLLHNRKGAAVGLFCRSCRAVVRCPSCAGVAAPTNAVLRCSRCARTLPLPVACVQCHNTIFLPFGAGTRRLAETLQEQFPAAHIAVLDSDSDDDVFPHDADIVIGTTLAKHDLLTLPGILPRLGLLIMTTFDALLAEPDMRSGERAWQELRGIAAFARTRTAEMIVHTITPEHPLFSSVLSAPSDFLAAEAGRRRDRGYPPFGRLIVISTKAGVIPRTLLTAAHTAAGNASTVLGPFPSAPHGARCIIKTPSLTPSLRRWLMALPSTFTLDTDPDIPA